MYIVIKVTGIKRKLVWQSSDIGKDILKTDFLYRRKKVTRIY